MDTEISHKQGRVRVEGELNIYSAATVAPKLFAALTKHRAAPLDLSAVAEFDTAGLQLLLAARRHRAEQARELSLVNPSQVVRDVMDLCRLSLPIVEAEVRPAKGKTAT